MYPTARGAGSERTGRAVRTGTERSDDLLVEAGRKVIAIEAASVGALSARLGTDFARACRLVADATGRVLVSGLGKSGQVARKLVATLTSTGTPAQFLHPVEALHGDLGIVGRADVAILVSKSGELCEVGGLLDHLARVGVPVVAIVGDTTSPLARHATVVLDCSVAEEACPLGMTPTASTTAALAMADALAMVVLDMKGFRREDFAMLHPGGALGRKLTLRVADAMVAEGYPWLSNGATVRDTIVPLATMRGTVPIVDRAHRLVGVVTAGDLTRLMERDPDFSLRAVTDLMTSHPRTARPDELASAAVHRMEEHGVMALPVVDGEGCLVGLVHLHDLMRSGAA
jgi:arabinose-5-phosphate isomerase